MDAKSKANFINSVAAGTTVPCPNCDASNTSESTFCVSCGAPLKAPAQEEQASTVPAFAPAKENAAPAKTVKYVEPNNAFAHGLPEWSLEPPQVMVRRH